MIVFTCNHCPYALAWHDRILDAARDYAGRGVRFLQINSNDAERYPRDSYEAMRARVAGAFTVVNYGVRPLGTLTAGILGSTIGLRPTLWIATAGALAGVLWLLPSPVPRLRELPPEPV